MNIVRRFLSIATLLVVSASAHAQLLAPPLSGFFWNPAEPGKGWALDVQDDLVFVAHYTFQPGSPASVFYTTVGRWDYVNRRFSGDLFEFTGGPCLTCGPSQSTPRNLGTATFQFLNRDQGSVTFQGRTTPIVRFLYGYAPESRSILLGVWHTTAGSAGLYFGDTLRITGPCTTCSTPGLYVGYILDGGAQRILLGGPVGSDPNDILMLVDSSTSYYDEYRFRFSLNFFGGTNRTYLKTSSPTGSGLAMVASRIAGGPNDATTMFGAPRAIGSRAASKAIAASDYAREQRNAEELAFALSSTESTRPRAVEDSAATGDVSVLRATLEAELDALRGRQQR